jgi:hypothetical protein
MKDTKDLGKTITILSWFLGIMLAICSIDVIHMSQHPYWTAWFMLIFMLQYVSSVITSNRQRKLTKMSLEGWSDTLDFTKKVQDLNVDIHKENEKLIEQLKQSKKKSKK